MEYPWRRDRSSSCPEIGNNIIYQSSPCRPPLDTGLRSTKHRGGISAESSVAETGGLRRDTGSEDHRSRGAPGPLLWDLQLVGFRPRLIDFEAECDFEPINTPVHRNIDSRREPWLSFPESSPTRANSICSSIRSNDDDSEDGYYNGDSGHGCLDHAVGIQHKTQRHSTKPRSGQLCLSPVQIGLRVAGRRGVDTIFGTRIIRNAQSSTASTQRPPVPMESTTPSVEYTRTPITKKKSPQQQTQSKDETSRAHETWQAVKTTIQRHVFLAKVRKICEWGRDNNSAVLFILLSWFIIFILAQTRVLRVDAREFLNPEHERKDQRFYPSTDSDWRPDPMSVVNLFLSKNSSQTILDAKIIYQLESIEERQGRLHDKVQSQLNGNAIVLEFMLQEMRNLKFAFSTISDKTKMEREIDRLKYDIKQCSNDILSRTTRNPVIIKQRPTYTVTKMTKTVIRQHYITPRSQHTVSTKVIFYPHDRIQPQETSQGTAAPLLADTDIDKIAERLVKSLDSAFSKESSPGDPWWNVFPSFSARGRGTKNRLTKQLELIVQLLCPEKFGLSADSFASRTRECLERRRSIASVLQSRMQSTVSNRILSSAVKFSDDLPPYHKCHNLADQISGSLDKTPGKFRASSKITMGLQVINGHSELSCGRSRRDIKMAPRLPANLVAIT
ncbi:hypothetical protein TWF506_007919 [Arthrobotrys conoides]|uniref:Uncharacterized protein n=1 Tax=Arthrobotrys conoides TaxID=74498 RepID=A0AAN8S003_9PEZI